MKKIFIGKDFSFTPMGRYYPKDGESSGERFRTKILAPALKTEDFVEVVIDDVEGYGSSFLEEAFGGLIRHEGFTAPELSGKLKILCEDQDFKIYAGLIQKYIEQAKKS